MRRPAVLAVVALALAAAGAILPSPALFAAGCGLAFGTVASLACVLAGTASISVAQRVPVREAEEGTTLSVLLSAHRRRRWPLRIEALDEREWRSLGSNELPVQVRIGRRGPGELPPVAVRVTDPLGIAERRLDVGTPVPVLALPRPEAGAAVAGAARPSNPGADLDPGGLRPYTPGTQLSRIHWASLARGGELMQREIADVPADAPLIVVDTRDAADRDAVDRTARAAVAAVTRLARSRGCRVLLPGAERPIHVAPDLRRWPEVLRRLALLEPRPTSTTHARA